VDIPTAAPSDAPSQDPTAEPTEASHGPSIAPSPSGGGSAAACTGNDGNRDFFASIAEAVDWPVYCAVLPARWFVDSGEFSLRQGGRLDISYKGPSGARLRLQEGYFCDTANCSGGGTELGDAAFGDLGGVLLDQGDGRYAMVTYAIDGPVWLLTTEGVSEDEARSIGAALTQVQ
jgi:hypothetical protein